MHADSVHVEFCFIRKWENLLSINIPYVIIFLIRFP